MVANSVSIYIVAGAIGGAVLLSIMLIGLFAGMAEEKKKNKQ